MKKTLLIIAAAVCLLTVVFIIWKNTFAQNHMLDGDGMERKNIGVEDDECGKWLSDQSPQWSLILEKYRLVLYHYGTETATVQVGNFKKPEQSGEYTQIELQKGITFSWPYSAYETAEFNDIYLDSQRLQLSFRLDDSTNETFSFRKAKEGEKEETELLKLDEGTILRAVSFHQQGTYMAPYYILKKTDEGYEVCRSSDEVRLAELDGDDEGEDISQADTETFAVSEEDVRMLTKQLLEYNVLTWDGFSESRSNDPDMLDGDSAFMLKLLFSDGTSVKASGYNAEPANGNEILSLIVRFFMAAEMTGDSTD